MKQKVLTTIIFFLIACLASGQVRETKVLHEGWKFYLGHEESAAEPGFDDSSWEDVFVPHDWAIVRPFIPGGDEATGKLPWQGEGWYRYELELPDHYKDKRIYLLFDGVMAFPSLFVNGKLAGSWDYGYNSFYLDVTEHLDIGGDNLIAVHVDTRDHDSRWYPGAGLYRKVSMIAVNPLHKAVWGSYITTPIIKPHYADVRVATWVRNTAGSAEMVRVVNIIRDNEGREAGRAEIQGSVRANDKERMETTITLADPKRWDIDEPYLYSVVTEIHVNDQLTDRTHDHFGVREIRFTADDGFHLNGRRVQLKGVNLHHDHGPLGAAFHPRAMERQLEIMKAMGVNTVRTSHNTPAPELLELCDKMGLLVFNEVFDKYDRKADIVDTTHFDNFAQRNIRNFVLRDRNNPSIFIWSVGNEVRDVQMNRDNGYYRLHTLVNHVRKYDPTRPVTFVCDMENSAALRHFGYYDVHSWNYGRRYKLARQLEPNKSVIVSESGSTVSTRGFFELPLPEKQTDFTGSLQVSSYDLNAPLWADLPDETFMWIQEEPYIAGEYVWTGFDYLGEPTPYWNDFVQKLGYSGDIDSRSTYFGIVDLCGIPKDRYYLYKSHWNEEEVTVHILPHWNWDGREGVEIPVFVYTGGDCAELFLNGRSLGKKCKDPKSDDPTRRFRLTWKDVRYEPGTLKTVAYDKGTKIGEAHVRTAGEPYKLRLSPDQTRIRADGMDLSYILIEALDKNGNPCPLAGNEMQVGVDGPARFFRVGNGNPQSLNAFTSGSVPLFHGKAMLILGSGFEKGKLSVTVSGKGVKKATVEINIE